MKTKCLFALIFSSALGAATLQVGPAQTFTKPCAAIAAAAPGDTILIDAAGSYTGDVCQWSTPGLTLRGVNGRPHIDAGGHNAGGKGIWVIDGDNNVVENIEFSGATVPDGNGAAIRFESYNLVVRGCYIHNNQDGILTNNPGSGDILIEYSEFAYNGTGNGSTHNIYIGQQGTFTLRYSYSHNAYSGQLVKSRAAENHILYNRLTTETGTTSYEVDISNGGLSYVIGNLIQQGVNGQNSAVMEYMVEGASAHNPDHRLFVVNNTFVNNMANGTFIWAGTADTTPAVLRNNIFYGIGTLITQASPILANNLVGVDPLFVNAAAFDYHLQAGSPAINAGIDPGLGAGQSLAAEFQYVHPACAETRTPVGAIDIGAYEYGNSGILQACPTGTGTPSLLTLSLNPDALTGGTGSVLTAILDNPAPAGGVVVNVSNSNNALASIPPTIPIAAGTIAATAPVATTAVDTSSAATLTASLGTASKAVVVTVNPPPIVTTIGTSPSGLLVTVDGASCTAPCVFQWLPRTTHTIAAANQSVGTGTLYTFSAWSDAGAASHSVVATDSATSYTATFATQYFLTTSANPSSGGSISPASGWFNAGSVVPVTATPVIGYAFSGFTGALTGTAATQYLTITAPATITAGFTVTTGGSFWYGAGGVWSNRKAIIINHAQVAGNFTSFPVLISLTDANLQTTAKADGCDILFTLGNGVTKLSHEIEQYSSATGKLVAWVNIPSLSSTADTVLYMYYGNPSASPQQNPTGVWDSTYLGVWHLPNGSNLTANDSTSHANNATTISNAAVVNGEIGGAAASVTSAMRISTAPSSSLSVHSLVPMSLSGWIKPNSFGGASRGRIIDHGDWMFYLDNSTVTGGLGFSVNGGATTATSTAGAVTTGVWQYVAISYNDSTAQFYVNGASKGAPAYSTAFGSSLASLYLGNRAALDHYMDGAMDELRISAVARPAAWILTEYRNQSAPGTFMTLGVQEGSGVPVTLATSPAGLSLMVDGNTCASPCNFQWSPGSSHTVTAPTQSAGTGIRYTFSRWSDGQAATHVFIGPAVPTTYTATFAIQYLLTTVASPQPGGIVSPASAWYNAGAVATVSATANAGYQFAGFSGSLTATTSPQTLTMSEPATVTATFAATSGSWYATGGSWSNRKALTINHTQVAGSLSSFPVLVSLTDANLKATAKTDGGDIFFTSADGLTKLNHEIERYNSATGELIAWVNLPSLPYTADTVLFMYYGNPSASPQQNPAGVWDSTYLGVWHLPNGSSLTANDSTSYANNATTIANALPIAGQVGGGAASVASAMRMSTAANASLSISGSVPVTLSGWIKLNSFGGASRGRIFDHGDWMLYADNSTQTSTLNFSTNDAVNIAASNSGAVATGVWQYVAVSYDNTAARFYVNGVARGAPAYTTHFSGTAGSLYLGNRAALDRSTDGTLDELRVSTVARSTSWIVTEYHNQSAPGLFISAGTQENHP